MQNLGIMPVTIDVQRREELIALSQLTAMSLNRDLFTQDDPVIVIVNGSGNAGKSLISTAFSAQLMDIRTSTLDVIGETTWESTNDSANRNAPPSLRLHFIDAEVACENPYDLIKTPDGRRISPEDAKREWKAKGDIIFLQNVPGEFRELADLEIVMSRVDGFGDWDRFVSLLVHNERIYDERFAKFFTSISHDVIEQAAKEIPENYLKPDGQLYGPILSAA